MPVNIAACSGTERNTQAQKGLKSTLWLAEEGTAARFAGIY